MSKLNACLLRLYANHYKWKEINSSNEAELISFTKDNIRIDVLFNYGTVLTTLHHPKRGVSTLERYEMTMDMIKKIFDNPRVHTGQGSY